jgi:hypothetical protein
MNLDKIISTLESLKKQVSSPIEFPEAAMKLDMKARANDPIRQFKYLHQMCTLHGEHFAISNQIKIVCLLDGYILLCNEKNPLGVYQFARSILELAAFINDISVRTINIQNKPVNNWQVKGEEFFSCLIRARFGTSHPKTIAHLKKHGVSNKLLKPINIMSSLQLLVKNPTAKGLHDKYAMLCDFVHHNLSSQITSSPGFRVGNLARSSGGGAFITSDNGAITRYQYPVSNKAELAIEETSEIVNTAMDICIERLNAMPRTPFLEKQLMEFTGSPLGVTQLY